MKNMKGMHVYGVAGMSRPHQSLSDKKLKELQKVEVKKGYSRALLDVNNEIILRQIMKGGAVVKS